MKSVRERAMDLLARREHSCEELRNKLISKGLDEGEVNAVIQTLAHEGLQDDERFAENYLRHRQRSGFGPRRIAQELQIRGIDGALIDRYVQYTDPQWQDVLQTTHARKYQEFPDFGTPAYATQLRFLVQRGFDHGGIHRLLKRGRYEISEEENG